MSLGRAIQRLRAAAGRLDGSGATNEANTRALLVEPLLSALGWDTSDPEAVAREVRVFDGTFLDYALKVDGVARVYVEAKAINESLADVKSVAQAVNYANNDGVMWCVLTNGVEWRVYKTNETASMDRKLLFEVDLSQDGVSESGNMLALVGRDAVIDGKLDTFGEHVFTDARVRRALSVIAAKPPVALLDAITNELGHPPVPADALERSIARVLDAADAAHATGASPVSRRDGDSSVGPSGPPRGREYPLSHHLDNKSALIAELFNEVNSYALALGADVSRRVRKQYVGYYRGKRSFFTVEFQKRRLVVYLGLNPGEARPWSPNVMRDVSAIGHFGMGDTEYSLTTTGQLDELQQLIRAAYGSLD